MAIPIVDILVLGTLAVTLVLGLLRGFLPQMVGITGIVGGLYLASRYSEPLREKLLDPRVATSHNGTIAFVGIVVVTVLVVAFIGAMLKKMVDRLQLSPYDRLMGGALGLLKGSLICAGILLAAVYFSRDGGELERAIGQSRSGPLLWRAMARVADLLPSRVRAQAVEFLERNALPEEHAEPAAGE